MAIKKTKYRKGAFLFEHTTVDLTKPDPGDAEAIRAILEAATPRGRIKALRPHVERLGAGLQALEQAESLINADGSTVDYWAFRSYIKEAWMEVQTAQSEEAFTYGLRVQDERRRGGLASRELTTDDLEQRNEIIQSEIDRLCTQRRLGFREACRRTAFILPEMLSEKYPDLAEALPQRAQELSPEHIRKRIAKNPRQ